MILPLSFTPIANTSSKEEAESLFSDQLVSSKIRTKEDENFNVSMNGVAIGNSVISAIFHKSNYDIDCGDIEIEDAVLFGYCAGSPAATSFKDKEYSTNDNGVIITKHHKVSHKRRGEVCEFVVKCSRESLLNRLQVTLDRHVSRSLVFEESISMRGPIGKHASNTMTYVLSTLETNPAALDSPLTAANLEDLLTGLMLSLPHSHSQQLHSSRTTSVAPAVVSLAEAYMEANAHQPITMTDVLEQVSCSRNTLFNNFRKFRGYTPWEFLTTRRLELAHIRLSRAHPQDTVTSIALELGFTHMGRFSLIYRKRYGEKPSETLRRSRL